MTWHVSPAFGTAHAMTTDVLGHVAICGRWRCEMLPPADTTAPRCPECARMLTATDAPKPQRKPPATVTRRNAAIRDVRKQNPAMSNVELAAAFGCSVAEVRAAVRTGSGRKPITPEKIAALRAARAAGKTVERIAAELRVSRSTVGLYTRKAKS